MAKDSALVLDGTAPAPAPATRRADGLNADGATVLAGYDHPHFGRWPAVTTCPGP